MTARNHELLMAAVVLAVGILALYGASQHPYSTEFGPDAGFFPFWIGLMEAVIGLLLLMTILRGDAVTTEESQSVTVSSNVEQVCAAAALLMYVIALPKLGFVVSNFLLLLALPLLRQPRRWRAALVYACVGTAAISVTFMRIFKLDLPTGLL